MLWHALKHPFNGVLGALAVVSFATADLKAGIVMISMIILSAGLRFWQEMRSQVQAESLRKMVRNETTVVRAENKNVDRKPNALDGLASDIATRELVPGDIVRLFAGDMIPGDLRLLESRDMFVTQSALTGEAMPVEKYEPERKLAPGQRQPGEGPSAEVLERGVIEGRRTFGNVIKYIKMTASSNFGNVFSVLVASALLPFLPMLAVQLLVQNLLYDFSQIAIPWDHMDAEFLKEPRRGASSAQRPIGLRPGLPSTGRAVTGLRAAAA